MPEGEGISFRLRFGIDDPEERRWLVVPLSLGPDHILEMLPNLFAARSTISQRALDELRSNGLIASGDSPFVLRDLRIVGQPVPDVAVHVGTAASILRVDGILGYDFVQQFSRIIFETRTRWVTLVP